MIYIKQIKNLLKNVIAMTIFNILLYGGISLIIIGLILFVISQYKLRGIENEIDKQKKLHQSFIRGKTKWIHLKKYLALNIRGFVAVRVANF